VPPAQGQDTGGTLPHASAAEIHSDTTASNAPARRAGKCARPESSSSAARIVSGLDTGSGVDVVSGVD
jgi:hypothetical protein